MGFFAFLMRNHVPANLLFVLVLVLGALAYQNMPRSKDPDINFNWINIITVLPGASAEEVEKRLTDPIEDAISRSVRNIRFVSSTSRESISSILVRFQELEDREFDIRIADLRREVQNVYTDQLPPEADDPQIYEITTSSGFPAATIVLSSPANDENLRRHSVQIKKALERLPGVDQARVDGSDEPELHIRFYPERLEGLGITTADLADTVGSYFRDVSVGDLDTSQGKWVVRLQGTGGSLEDLESYPVLGANGVVSLGSLADIYRAAKEPSKLVSYQGNPAVLFSITKQEGANTLELLDSLQAFIEQRNAVDAARGLELVLADDQTASIRKALGLMQKNALIGLILVVLATWIFLGSRIALLTGIGIPFTLSGTFLILQVMGMTLNSNVLLGVVIVLGMIVDDAVVVVESIYYRLQRGMEKFRAGVHALREVAAPVTTSVMTTIAAFLPLTLLPGILGDFMMIIPMIVAVALLVSLIEAFWMLPTHVLLLHNGFSGDGRLQALRERWTHKLRVRYSRALISALRYPGRAMAIVAAIMLLAAVLLASGAIKMNFFATEAYRILYVNVELPSGTSLEETLRQVQLAEERSLQVIEPVELRSSVSYSGQMQTITEPLFGDNIGQVLISLNPQTRRGRHVLDVADAVRARMNEMPISPEAKVTIFMIDDGPPIGRPISVKVRGDSFADLQVVTGQITGFMEQQDGLFRDVTTDYRQGSPELVLALDGDAIKRAGLRPEHVTRVIQAYVDGEIINQFQDAGEEVSVRLLARSETGTINDLLQHTLSRPDGQVTMLGDLVQVSYGHGQQNIRHYNFLRAITLEADIDDSRTNTVAANQLILDYWETIAARYPGVELDFSGELDDIRESLDAGIMLFVMGLGLIYLILGTQFRSYWQPLMVLVSVPLAFTGVVIGLMLTGNDMNLYTLYGVVALAGISVNAAIVLISAANDRLARGMSVNHATLYAARRRIVPILITSFTTIAGLFSLAAGFAGESVVWGPVATTIVSGLVSSTLLTLFVVPLVFRLAMTGFRASRETWASPAGDVG